MRAIRGRVGAPVRASPVVTVPGVVLADLHRAVGRRQPVAATSSQWMNAGTPSRGVLGRRARKNTCSSVVTSGWEGDAEAGEEVGRPCARRDHGHRSRQDLVAGGHPDAPAARRRRRRWDQTLNPGPDPPRCGPGRRSAGRRPPGAPRRPGPPARRPARPTPRTGWSSTSVVKASAGHRRAAAAGERRSVATPSAPAVRARRVELGPGPVLDAPDAVQQRPACGATRAGASRPRRPAPSRRRPGRRRRAARSARRRARPLGDARPRTARPAPPRPAAPPPTRWRAPSRRRRRR